jgi:NAD(P)-dependent dehydrogenase (short-subunit alcohol dehydrogenase family)
LNLGTKYFDLTGKHALVTGASKGLGRVFARALAEAGSTTILLARNKENIKEVASEISEINDCHWYSADITNEEQIKKVVTDVIKKTSKIDILVNNAGTSRINIPPEKTSLEEWKFPIETNLTGTFICSQIVGREMIKRHRGKIINLASIAGSIINKGVHGGAYDCSKLAIVSLTRALAVEWAQYNIQVNAIAPGYFLTDPNKKFFELDPDFYKTVIEMTPLKRIGRPEELSGVVIFLASDATNFMTGQVVTIDGGYTLW